jgi:transposase
MDASASNMGTDILGRRSGSRRRRSMEEKRRIVEETLQPGASVSTVAHRHELNANVVFLWRRLYREGLLGGPPASVPGPLLPVRVLGAAGNSASGKIPMLQAANGKTEADLLEIQFADGTHVRAQGDLAHEALRQLIASVRSR